MYLRYLHSLRVRLAVLICLSSALPLIVVLYNTFYEQERLESDAIERTYKLAQLAAQYQNGLVAGTRELLASISHTPLVVSEKWALCDDYLANVLAENRRYSNLGVADLNGDIVCSGMPLPGKVNVKDRQYFIRAQQTGKFAVGDYHLGRITRAPSIGMAMPVVGADNRIKAVAFAAINLQTLKQTADVINPPKDGVLLMFDRNGSLLVESREHGQSAWVVEHAAGVLKNANPGSSSNAEILRAPDNCPWVFAVSRLDGLAASNDISVVVATPMQSILQKSRQDYFYLLGALFLGSLLIFALTLVAAQALIVRRIQTLISATKFIGRGKFNLNIRQKVGGGELGQLAGYIDDMAVQLEKFFAREQEYRLLFERNPNPMWIFSREYFRFLAVNQAAVKHFGYTHEEFLELSIRGLLPPDEVVRAQEFVASLRDNQLQTSIWRMRKRSGEIILVEAATHLIQFRELSAIMVSLKDITHETQVRARLADRDEQIRSMLESSVEGICGMDIDGRCTFANSALLKMLGYDNEEELIGRDMHALIHHSKADGSPYPVEECNIHHAVHKGGRYHSDQEVFWRKDGSMLPVEYWSCPIRRGDEIVGIVVSFLDITDRKQQQLALEFQASHDSLTGLPNRWMLSNRLQALCEDPSSPFFLLIIDLDRFKEVNDALGHPAGDSLLVEVARRLQRRIVARQFLARLGGDEFAVVLPDVASAIKFAELLVHEIEQPIEITDIRVQIGASVGIAEFPADGQDPGSIMRCADVAMYTAKNSGAIIAMYDQASDIHTAEHLGLMSDLHLAINRNELRLHFQPKIRLQSRGIDSFEALIRWEHPHKGMIPPNQFIPLVEMTSLIRPFTAWVLENALAACREWRDQGVEAGVAVNISTRNLLDLALPAQIDGLLARYGLPPECLELEITESAIMADPVRSRDILTRIRQRGVRVSIDDFGTGYSSLAYLQTLPINALKIDRTFICKMMVSEEAIPIVSAIINLAHSLKIEVVAEGVEDEATLEILTDLGCDIVQGYLISRPMAIEQLCDWLEKRQQHRAVS